MDAMTVVFLSTVINRITEQVKVALLNPSGLTDEQKSALTLFISLVLGVIGVLVFFPATNLFVGLGRGEWAELIATGIVIGGLANGIDFLANRIARAETSSKATLSIVETHEATDTKAVA